MPKRPENKSDASVKIAVGHLKNAARADHHDSSETDLQVISASLRILLADGLLAEAWRNFGYGPIVVRAKCFVRPPGADTLAFSGDADMEPGIPVSIGWGQYELEEKTLNLHDFIMKPCAYLWGTPVRRLELIKYVANTKGGAHFDPGRTSLSRKPIFEALRDAEENGFHGVGIKLNNRNLVHHELAATLRSLLRSPQVQLFRNAPWHT